MAQIELAIDVDTTDVAQADAAFDKFEANLKGATKSFGAVATSSQKADRGVRGFADATYQAQRRASEAATQMQRMQTQITAVSGVVTRGIGLFNAYIGYQVVKGIITSADAWGTLHSRVEQAVGGQERAAQVLDQIGAIAERTQGRVGAVADSWLRMAPALQEAGRSTQQTLDFTEALNAALLVSGARGSEAAAVQLQLAQAMASGVLRGDELNSIMEQGGKVTRLIAEELGVGVGQLRALAEQGAITGDVIDRALRGNLEALRSEAAEMPRTVGAAFGGLADAVQRLAGEVNQATGATSTMAAAIEGLIGFVNRLSDSLDDSSAAGVAWAANLDAASRNVAISTAKNISVAIVALDELKRAQASITPLEGSSPFTIPVGEDRVGNAVSETEKLIRLQKQRLAVQQEHVAAAVKEETATAGISEFTSRINAALGSAVAPAKAVEAAMGGGGRGGGGGIAGGAKKAADEVAKISDELDYQSQAANDLMQALRGVAFGTITGGEGAGSIVSALTKGAFGKQIDDAFKDAADTLSGAFSKAMSGLGKTGLTDFGAASIGTGIGIAAVGAINGNAQQIGGGIGSAIGGAVGSSLVEGMGGIVGAIGGPLGMILGGVVGGFLANGLGGGNKWTGVSGTAFTGTTYAQDTSVRVKEQDGANANARLAVEGTLELIRNWNDELTEYVEAAGGTMKKGTLAIKDEWATLKAITGVKTYYDVTGKGPEADKIAAEISAKVAAIMALAGTIAAQAGPALTQAQKIWRETQEKFSKENVEILKTLGFSSKEIFKAQADIKKDLAQAFNKEQLDAIIDTGHATKAELAKWKGAELTELNKWKAAQLATAKEIGASQALVLAAAKAKKLDIVSEWKDMLGDLVGEIDKVAKVTKGEKLAFKDAALDELVQGGDTGALKAWLAVNKAILAEQHKAQVAEAKRLGVEVALINKLYHKKLVDLEKEYGGYKSAAAKAAAEAAAKASEWAAKKIENKLGWLNDKLNTIESKRADVLQELTRRAEEARQAEEALADARRGLAGGDLNPGGPMAQFRALQAQFNAAVKAAKGGNADAAGTAASLASSLLQAGKGVYASGGGYSDLFKLINAQLLEAQKGFGNKAGKIEKQLDAATFSEVTEKSTKALLLALGHLNASVKTVNAQIAAQTKKLTLAQQKQKVGAAA